MMDLRKNHGEIDPSIEIPEAVKQHASKADELFYAAYPDKAPKPVVDPNAHVDNHDDPAPEVKAEVPPPAPKVEPTAPEPPPEVVTQQGNEPPIDWEHRYNSMKGRYDRLQSAYTSLEGVVATLQAQRAAPTAAPSTPRERLITPQEEADYGDELLNVVAKRAREELMPEIERLQGLVQQTTTVTAEQARQRVFARLDTAVPSWNSINNQPEFLAWLDLPDAFSGAKRMELLQRAFGQNDADRVLAFFNGFLAEEAAIAPQPQPSPAPAPQKVPLEQFAAPGRAKTTAPQAPVEKPYISTADITAFYSDIAAGKYKGRDEEKDRLEAMIFEAQRDGRIRS